MQARQSNKIVEQFELVYTIHRGIRLIIYAGLLGIGGLLTWSTVSVWPRCWHILVRVLPLVSRLMVQRGIMAPLLLALLTVQVLTWPVLWVALMWLGIAIVRHRRRKRRHTASYGIAWQRERYDVGVAMQGLHAQVTDEIPVTSAWQPQGTPSWIFTAETLWQEKSGSDAGQLLYPQEQESPFWTYAPESL